MSIFRACLRTSLSNMMVLLPTLIGSQELTGAPIWERLRTRGSCRSISSKPEFGHVSEALSKG